MFWTYAALLLLVFVTANVYGRFRAMQVAGNQLSVLHSRPTYHGGYLAILAVLPASVLLIAWAIIEPRLLNTLVINANAQLVEGLSKPELQAFLRDARAIAFGGIVGSPTLAKSRLQKRSLRSPRFRYT